MRIILLLNLFIALVSNQAWAISLTDKVSGSYILEWNGAQAGLGFFDQENSDYFYFDGRGQGLIPTKCIGRYTVEMETLKARMLFCEDTRFQGAVFEIAFPKETTFETLALPLTFQRVAFDSLGALKKHQEDFRFHTKIITKEGDHTIIAYSESSLKSLADVEAEAIKQGTYRLELALQYKEKFIYNGVERFLWKNDTVDLEKQGASGLSLGKIKERLAGMQVQINGQSAVIKRKQTELVFGDRFYQDRAKLMLAYDLSRKYVAPAVVRSIRLDNGATADLLKCEGSVVIGQSACTKGGTFTMSKNSHQKGLPAINSCVRDLFPEIGSNQPVIIRNYGIYNAVSSHAFASAIDIAEIKAGSHSVGFERANEAAKLAIEQFVQMRAPHKTVFTRDEIDELSSDFFHAYKRGKLGKLEIMEFWTPFFDCLSTRGVSTSAWFSRDFYLIFKLINLEANLFSNKLGIDRGDKRTTHFNNAHVFMFR